MPTCGPHKHLLGSKRLQVSLSLHERCSHCISVLVYLVFKLTCCVEDMCREVLEMPVQAPDDYARRNQAKEDHGFHPINNNFYMSFIEVEVMPSWLSLVKWCWAACQLVVFKSKLLVLVVVNTTASDQGCQYVTGRFGSIRMLLSKQSGWPTFVQQHPSVRTAEWIKKQLSHNLCTYRKGEN